MASINSEPRSVSELQLNPRVLSLVNQEWEMEYDGPYPGTCLKPEEALTQTRLHTSHTVLFESDSDDELPGQVAPASSPSHEGDWLHPDLVEHNHMLQLAEQPVSAGHPCSRHFGPVSLKA